MTTSTILIADDERTARQVFAGLLTDEGYQLIFAVDGQQALDMAEKYLPDVVLLDVMMPKLDGIEVCRILRANPLLAEVPIVMVTALDDRSAKLTALEAGADDFITKPFDRLELRARVGAITRLNRYRRLAMERQKRLAIEQEMQERNREIALLKQAEQFKDQLISNISHELCTPLTSIMLLGGNLDNAYHNIPDTKRKEMIHKIRQHARVLQEMIDSILDMSHIASGQLPLQFFPVDLGQIILNEAQQQVGLSDHKKQTVTLQGDPNLNVMGDAEQILHVVRNLINNAIKYTPTSGQIWCEWRHLSERQPDTEWPQQPPGPWGAFRIKDTGIGITPEQLPHLFERFYRGVQQTNIPGTGLGLSITQELVKLHHGHIGVTSEPGQSTTFAVYLPLA